MTYFVYILRCKDGTLYTGYTTDIARRIEEHNAGVLGARYTKGRGPVALVHSEEFATRSEALTREWQIKKMSRIKKMALGEKCT